MDLHTLLCSLAQRGVTVALDGDAPKLRGRTEAVTDADVAALKEQRADVIAWLRKPLMIEWRTPTEGIVLTSLLGNYETFVSDAARRRVCKPWIPFGVTGWRRIGEASWWSLNTLPEAWDLAPVDGSQVVLDEEEEETA